VGWDAPPVLLRGRESMRCMVYWAKSGAQGAREVQEGRRAAVLHISNGAAAHTPACAPCLASPLAAWSLTLKTRAPLCLCLGSHHSAANMTFDVTAFKVR